MSCHWNSSVVCAYVFNSFLFFLVLVFVFVFYFFIWLFETISILFRTQHRFQLSNYCWMPSMQLLSYVLKYWDQLGNVLFSMSCHSIALLTLLEMNLLATSLQKISHPGCISVACLFLVKISFCDHILDSWKLHHSILPFLFYSFLTVLKKDMCLLS